MLLDPTRIRPHHRVTNPSLVRRLVTAMRAHGWQGRKILLEVTDLPAAAHTALPLLQGWTGTHRLAAAVRAGVWVPAASVDPRKLAAAVVDGSALQRRRGAYLYGLPEGWYDEDRARFLESIGDAMAASLLHLEVATNAAEKRKRRC